MEGRPDLAAFFEGMKELTNWNLRRAGGISRRVGTIFVSEVKNQLQDTILLPMAPTAENSFIVELGHLYVRFFNGNAPVRVNPNDPPYEITSPYTEAQLRDLHYTQSVDVMWLFHPNVQQRKLTHLGTSNWTLNPVTYSPPPLHEEEPTFAATHQSRYIGLVNTAHNLVIILALLLLQLPHCIRTGLRQFT